MFPLFSDAAGIDIVMPCLTFRGTVPWIFKVNAKSPRQHRRAVFRCAQYFRREMRFDFVQYGWDGEEYDPHHTAYAWTVPDCEGLSGGRVHVIGACCFRMRDDADAMQWVWLHPFYRRQGILSRSWMLLRESYGRFEVEGPLSDAMQSFVRKITATESSCSGS